MSKITVDSELRAKLNGLDEQLQMCDEAGNVLGRFLPEDQYAKLGMRFLNPMPRAFGLRRKTVTRSHRRLGV